MSRTALALAFSPTAWPPIPSATMNTWPCVCQTAVVGGRLGGAGVLVVAPLDADVGQAGVPDFHGRATEGVLGTGAAIAAFIVSTYTPSR